MRNIATSTKSAAPAGALPAHQAAEQAGPYTHAHVKRLRIALGTLVAIEATASSHHTASNALEAAFTAVAEVERRMHPHSPDSDLARISQLPVGTPVPVHASTCNLLQFANHVNALSAGVFDPCLPTQPGCLRDIEVDATRVICRKRVALDFGGFAKGYAVDCAIDALLANGCHSGLVNAGGDLRVFGVGSESLFVRGTQGSLMEVALADAALAVSDANARCHPFEHQGYYSRPIATGNALVRNYAAVVAKRAMIADALTKCVLLCPMETADRVLGAFDAQLVVEAFDAPLVVDQ